MTVAELIEALKKVPQDYKVIYFGNEGEESVKAVVVWGKSQEVSVQ